MKDSTKIGIARWLSLIGVEENYKIDILNGYNQEYCTKIKCDTCRFIKTLENEDLKELLISNSCMRNCPNINKKIKLYKSEKNDYKIKEILLLSKSKLKQYLFYHSVCDSYGGVFNLSVKHMAKELKYTERTIKNNNNFFVHNNLICLGKMDTDSFSLFIPGYKDYFKFKEEYGRGYVELSKEVMKKILKATNIADIRFTLRKLIEYSKFNKSSAYDYVYVEQTYAALKRILPSYINCPKKINNFIKNSKIDVFRTEFTGNGIKYILREQFNNHVIKDLKNRDYQYSIINHIHRRSRSIGCEVIGEPINDIFSLTNLYDYVKDFVQMAVQYELKLVLDALDYLLIIVIKDNFNGNCGAVVRNRIKDTIYRQTVGIL